MNEICIEIKQDDVFRFKDLKLNYPKEVKVLREESLIDDPGNICLFVTLTPIIITKLAQIIITIIKQKQPISITIDGKDVIKANSIKELEKASKIYTEIQKVEETLKSISQPKEGLNQDGSKDSLDHGQGE